MSFLAISVVWPRLIHPASHMGTDWSDFVRGAIFGFAIGLLLMMASGMAAQRRRDEGHESTETDPAPHP